MGAALNIRFVTLFLNGFLMIAMPVVLAIILTRKFKLGWRLFWIGAATFVLSQVGHIPFNVLVNPVFNQFGFIALHPTIQLLIRAVFLGLSAGGFEEFSRYAMYRWWAKDARSWGRGLLAGTGHGGIEAIIVGALALYGFIQIAILSSVDVAQVVPAAQVETVRSQVAAALSMPVYMTLLGAVERLFAISLHLACSLLVMQAFTRRKFGWVGLAVLLHALADGVAVYALGVGLSYLAIEGMIGLFAIASVVIIFSLRQPEPQPDPSTGSGQRLVPAPAPAPEFTPRPPEETDENLEKTRFQ